MELYTTGISNTWLVIVCRFKLAVHFEKLGLCTALSFSTISCIMLFFLCLVVFELLDMQQ